MSDDLRSRLGALAASLGITIQPGNCTVTELAAMMNRDILPAIGGDPIPIGDGTEEQIAAALDVAFARAAENTYRPTGLGDYVGNLHWRDSLLGHVYASIVAADLHSIDGTLTISSMADLVSIDLSALASVSESLLVWDDDGPLPELASLDVSGLTSVTNDVRFGGLLSLTSLDISALTSIGGHFYAYNTSLPSLDLSGLTSVDGHFYVYNNASLTSLDVSGLSSIGDLRVYENASLTSLDLSDLTSAGGNIRVWENDSLTSLDFSGLTSVDGDFYVNEDGLLSSVDISSLTTISGEVELIGNASLITLDITSLTSVGGDFDASDSAFHQASVDGILVRLAALDGTGGTTSYDDHEITITGTSSAPSGAGLAAIAILESTDRGCTVTVNS